MCNSITASASYGTICYLNIAGKPENANICAMSNKFVGVSYDNRTSLPTGYRIFIAEGTGAGSVTLRFPNNSNIDTLQEVKDFVDSNEIIAYYVASSPNDIEITNTSLIEQLNNLEKLMSYNGTTNISVSGNLPIILNVKALKGE